MRLARLDAYNLTVQHQLSNTVSMEVAFVGNNGHGFYANNPDNYLVPDNAWPFFKQFSLP